MKASKGFSLLELVVVLIIMNILATVALALYVDYTKKARLAEAPPMLKSLATRMIEYAMFAGAKSSGNCENVDSNGQCQNNYPNDIEKTGFKTTNGTTFGNFFEYRIHFITNCGNKQMKRFAYALPIVKSQIPEDYQYQCMNERFDFRHSSESVIKTGGNKGGGNNGGGNSGGGKNK